MRFLLDTNVLSEPFKPRPDPRVEEWLDEQPPEHLAISALSFGEIWAGILPLGYGHRRKSLTQWLWTTLPRKYSGRIVPVNAAIALEWGRLTAEAKRRGRKISVEDMLLVATAVTLKLTIVTRNVRHCGGWGAPIINPWSGKASD
jgi:predicted nucleic acid-binding protein